MHRSAIALFGICVCSLLVRPGITAYAQDKTNTEEAVVKAIFDEALVNGDSYRLLDDLCTNIGGRLSGSENAARAVEWGKGVMEEYGFDRVYLQDVMVPHWERGDREQARIVNTAEGMIDLRVLAIGGSVATPPEGLTAPVVEVLSLDEVEKLGRGKIEGKIVFYNRPFDQTNISTGASYGGAVVQRTSGPSKAAEYGAAAIVIRSVTSSFDDAPHTGTLVYRDGVERIPAAALGFRSADRLAEILDKEPSARLYLRMNCRWLPDAPSYNVVGELRGSEKPDEVILVGGHLDSWDVAQGAHDDGAGCVHALGVLRIFQKLGIRPRHTLRAVLFMNEENGTRGARRYAELAKQHHERHVVALESDEGGFSPRGFGVSAPDGIIGRMRAWLPRFPRNTISYIRKGGGGADVGPLHREMDTPVIGLIPDSQRYFDYHHSVHDTFDKVNRRELELGTASITSLIYLIDKYGLKGTAAP